MPIGSTMSSLRIFRAGSNSFSYPIPKSAYELDKLQVFMFDFNLVNGSISSRIGLMDGLEVLSGGYNRLEGHIPEALFNLNALSRLELENNQLSGDVPKNIGSARALKIVDLSGNIGLTGERRMHQSTCNCGLNGCPQIQRFARCPFEDEVNQVSCHRQSRKCALLQR